MANTVKSLAADYKASRDRFLLEWLRLGLWLVIFFNFTLLVVLALTGVENPGEKKLLPSLPWLLGAINSAWRSPTQLNQLIARGARQRSPRYCRQVRTPAPEPSR